MVLGSRDAEVPLHELLRALAAQKGQYG